MTPLEKAISQIGITEHPLGSNAGVEVESYLKSVGLGKGYSWCMAFVYWCFTNSDGGAKGLIKTGGVLRQWNEVNAMYKVVRPEVGDIFIMDFGKGKGHTGFVSMVDGDKIHTVEGNSDSSGSRTGGSVCINTRSIKSIKGFIRINNSQLIKTDHESIQL